jgi:hypothetical protein
MYPQTHALASLFKHLGLAHDEVAIARFIEQHSPLQERGKNAANSPRRPVGTTPRQPFYEKRLVQMLTALRGSINSI